MSLTIADRADTVIRIKDRLATIDADIARLRAERENAFILERDDWRARGYEAHILMNGGRYPVERLNTVHVWETLDNFRGDRPWTSCHYFDLIYQGDEPRAEWGVYAGSACSRVWIHKGTFVCTLSDDGLMVVAKVRELEPSREQFGRAVARLRAQARSEHMRVSVRDRDVSLISPMNDLVHSGTVTTAALWLCGIDRGAVRQQFKISEAAA